MAINKMVLKLNGVIAALLAIAALMVGHTTAQAAETVSLSEDPDIPEGTVGHWYVNMQHRNELQLTLTTTDLAAGKGTFKVYDDGGKNGNNSPSCNSALKITVPVGYILQASGTVWTKNDIDHLSLYNFYFDIIGYSLANVRSDADGEGKDFGPVATSKAKNTEGQYLTLYFLSSDNETTYAGFDMTVTVIENTLYNVGIATGIAHGSVSVSPAQARYKEEVTITATPDAHYHIGTVSYNDGTGNHVVTANQSGAYKFTMPQSDVTVSATFLDEIGYLWGVGNDGSAEHPYVIRDKEGYDLLVEHSKTNSYADKHFELTADISGVASAIGSNANYPFCGHIDGKGHKVTLALESTSTLKTPAMMMWAGEGCTVENLTVGGTITMTDGMYGAGFISQAKGAVALTNCRSSITLTYTADYGTPHNGGFIGKLESRASATLTRCLFDGVFISSTAQTFCGMVGSGANVIIQNSVVATAAATSLTATVNNDNNAFALSPNTTNWSNNYYVYDNSQNHLNGTINRYQGNGQTLTYQLTLNDGATAAHSGSGTTIGNGAATVYADGFSYGGNEYYPQGTTVTLGNTPADGMSFLRYTSSGATIGDAGTFTMPAQVVTVGAHYQRTDYANHWQASLTRDGSSEQKAFLITTSEGLNLLAGEVNGGNTFAGKFFKLDADINYSHTTAWNDDNSTENNYTPIGYNNDILYFSGTFDGQNHTVRGIRHYSNFSRKGIFGYLKYGTVKNVILADARIAGYNAVGGIVGKNDGSTIENCHATETVTIRAIKSYASSLGGIVGYNRSSSTVSRCTSAARIMTIDGCTDINSFGGIVGYNTSSGTVSDCTAAGAIIANVDAAGAIVGHNDFNSADNTSGILTGNTYHSCLVGTNAFNIGVGFHGTFGTASGEYGDRTGATLDRTKLFLYDDRNNTDIIAAYSAPTSHTAYSGNAPSVSNLTVTLKGRTLFKDGAWNTLCLPFGLSENEIAASQLAGATIMMMDVGSYFNNEGDCWNPMEHYGEQAPAGYHCTGLDGNTLYLYFKTVKAIEAGKPYIIRWTSGDNLVNPTIQINASYLSMTFQDYTSWDGKVTFKGITSPEAFTANDYTKLFLGANNKLYYPSADKTIGAFRAYFQLNEELRMKSEESSIKEIVLSFGEEDEETSLTGPTPDPSLVERGDWYDLSGRKIANGQLPTAKGLYIKNGKKILK